METPIKQEIGNANKEGQKRKRKWGSMILNFLMYGGWMLVAIAILGIIILYYSLRN